jgi:hypothetical protein
LSTELPVILVQESKAPRQGACDSFAVIREVGSRLEHAIHELSAFSMSVQTTTPVKIRVKSRMSTVGHGGMAGKESSSGLESDTVVARTFDILDFIASTTF